MRQHIILWCIFQFSFFFLLSCDHATKPEPNRPPQIEKVTISSGEVEPGNSVEIRVTASDPDGDKLQYSYDLTGGSITDPDSSVTIWVAPQQEGTYTITVTVSDGNLSDKDSVTITVISNKAPTIDQIYTSADTVEPGGSVEIRVTASDPDGDKLEYSYYWTGGSITDPDNSVTTWIAPQEEGTYKIMVTVSDGKLSDTDSVTITVLLPNRPPNIEQISASADTVEPTGSIEIQVTASDPDGDELQYSYDMNGGSITDPDSPVTLWIAPQEEGRYTITVTVSDGDLSDQDSIIITVRIVIPTTLGIYSETAPYRLQPGNDSFIGLYTGNGGIYYEFTDDNIVFKEGGISKKFTISVDGSKGQWAGWFVQWGKEGSPDSETRDMSFFKGGKLTFWVKSPINLEIGIRSGNKPPGTEISKVILNSSTYPPFKANDEWYKITIPLSDFTDPSNKADLSQIKIFFNVASNTPSGGTGGVQKSFWIDDVRWEK